MPERICPKLKRHRLFPVKRGYMEQSLKQAFFTFLAISILTQTHIFGIIFGLIRDGIENMRCQ